jgi:hypothetical protein
MNKLGRGIAWVCAIWVGVLGFVLIVDATPFLNALAVGGPMVVCSLVMIHFLGESALAAKIEESKSRHPSNGGF